MSLEIIPLGGYGEVGRNCTAVKVDDELFILDLGLHLDHYVRLTDTDDFQPKLSKKLLTREQAVPDLSPIDVKKVKGILISHAHLDHVGAVPFLANSFECDVHATPFTIAVAKKLAEDKKVELRNGLVAHEYREIFPLSKKVSAEFIEVTHSTPHTAAIALHTPYGVVLYVNDFKLDGSPVIGNATDVPRLKELDVKALIVDTLYADVDEHCASEQEARRLLEETLLDPSLRGKGVIVSTFSSQIARLQELAAIAKKMKRKIFFVGRSIAKYLEAAHDVGITDLIEKEEVVRYSSKARRTLAKISCPEDYLFVVTGGMGERRAVLSRILDEHYLPLHQGDVIVLSNRTIPTSTIIADRNVLEEKIKDYGFVLVKDRHVSGHGAGKDHASLLDMVGPEFVLPLHGERKQREAFRKIAQAHGLAPERVLVLANGEAVDLD